MIFVCIYLHEHKLASAQHEHTITPPILNHSIFSFIIIIVYTTLYVQIETCVTEQKRKNIISCKSRKHTLMYALMYYQDYKLRYRTIF